MHTVVVDRTASREGLRKTPGLLAHGVIADEKHTKHRYQIDFELRGEEVVELTKRVRNLIAHALDVGSRVPPEHLLQCGSRWEERVARKSIRTFRRSTLHSQMSRSRPEGQ